MATKTDFTEQEWSAVADAPQMAGIAVMVAGASPLVKPLAASPRMAAEL